MKNSDRRQWSYYNYYSQLGILCLLLIGESDRVGAQIIPDSTLGTSNSIVKQVTPQAQQIDGGAIRGNNLFHSFTDFNIGDGNRADFANPAGITNIFSRVTGNNPSLIYGTLGISGAANLFFLNPNGIVFGQNAKLDVSGAFVGTTANSFQFGNSGSFGTIDPTTLPVLTIDTPAPISLQFASAQPGAIINNGDLATKPGQSLILAGGTIASPGTLVADGGQIALVTGTDPNAQPIQAGGQPVSVVFAPQANIRAGLALPDLVNKAGSNLSLVVNPDRSVGVGNTTQIVKPGDILVNQIDTSSNISNTTRNGGGVLINASGQIQVPGSIDASSYYGAGAGGRIDLISPKGLTLDNSSGCNLECIYSKTTGVGTGGALNIRTRSLTLLNGAGIGTRTSGVGNAGNMNVIVPDFIEIVSSPTIDSGLFATSRSTATGNGGDIFIQTNRLTTRDGGFVSVLTNGKGNAGNIRVVANSIELTGAPDFGRESGLFTETYSDGNGGNIDLQTNKLTVLDGARVSSMTRGGSGNAGNIRVAADTIELNGAPAPERESSMFASSESGGSAGNIEMRTRTLLLINGGEIATDTVSASRGTAGNIQILATESVTVGGFPLYVGARPTGIYSFTGNDKDAGAIEITTGKLAMFDGSSISAGTDGAGNGGAVKIKATDSVSIVGSTPLNGNGTRVRSITSNVGNGGDIIINTPNLKVADGARIDNRTGAGSGNGGNIQINANRVELLNGGQLISSTQGQGQAGKIAIDVAWGDLFITGSDVNFAQKAITFPSIITNEGAGSAIVTRAKLGSTGKSGDIQIQARNVNLSNEGKLISTTAGTGDSGSIQVTADAVNILDRSQVTVNSQSNAVAGNIQIKANTLTVGRDSKITAQTTAANGGNIRLETRDLLRLRGDSEISTTAGTAQAGGNGGNISIVSPQGFVIADPAMGNGGNDITANAYTGNGGRVSLTAQGLFGLIFRPQLTAFNDITASSTFGSGGVVQINTPQVDPSRGLSVLPVVNRVVGVAEGCQASGSAAEQRVAYFDIGRGGMSQIGTDGMMAEWIDVGTSRNVVGGMSKLPVAMMVQGCGKR